MGTEADVAEVLTVVVAARPRNGALEEVVEGAQGARGVEDVAAQRVDAAQGAVTAEDQTEGELPEPGLGDGEVDENAAIAGVGSEGLVEGVLGLVGLLVDERAADVVGGGKVAEGLGTREGSNGELLALVRKELLGSTGGRRGGGGAGGSGR